MKVIIFSLLSILLVSINAQVCHFPNNGILLIDNESISKEEFLHGFYKNKTDDSSLVKADLDEYLDLYINFKLKVKEAESLGLDTVASFLKEYKGYKDQLTESYLIDKNVSDQLIQEAYDRMQEEVKASHILIEVSPDALPEDTLKAYNKIVKLKQRAEKGESFEALAGEYSNDPSAKKNSGDLGFFSALKMVYPFESAAYSTAKGEISNPVRTRFGYHIIKVTDKRKSTGEWKVAHIMVKTPKDQNEAGLATAEKLINEIYLKVEAGDDFGNLARTYSDDAGTRKRGGVLPWFRSNSYPEDFESVCYKLAKDGDYSKPFKTEYGFHIVKRMEVRENPSFEDSKARIERKVSKDSRSKVTKKVTYKRLLAEYDFKDLSKNLKFVYPLVDSSFFTKDWEHEVGSKGKKKLFVLAGQNYTVNDFVSYLDKYNGKRKRGDLKVVTYKLYERWKEESTFNYEKTQLASKYPEYGRLLNEYKNGILLFNLMEQKVWNKAINDTTGLEQFFESNQEDYMWAERVDAEIFTCDNDSTAKALIGLLENKASVPVILEKLNINSALKVRVDHGVYEKEDEEVLSMIDWKLGVSKEVNLNDKVYVVNIAQLLEKGPKKLNDSRGLIIADYQTHLDKEWVKVLREKYTYSVNKESYNSLFE